MPTINRSVPWPLPVHAANFIRAAAPAVSRDAVRFSAPPVEIEAAAADAPAKPRKFNMVAYTGGGLAQPWSDVPIVVDLAGMDTGNGSRPILINHDNSIEAILGQTESIEVVGGNKLKVAGSIFGESDLAKQVIALNDKGFRFQASIGARILSREFVAAGVKATANGRTFAGPVVIARKTVLGEVSFVALGADDRTTASIAATAAEGSAMDFEQWLAAMGLTSAGLNEDQATKLRAKFDAEQKPKDEPKVQAKADAPADPTAELRAQYAAESKRVADVRKAAAGNAEIEAKAIADGWDATRTELEVLRASRPKAPAGHVVDNTVTSDVLEAAACLSGGMDVKAAEKAFDEKTLTAADKQFKRRLGLQEMIYVAAQANGYSGGPFAMRSDLRGVLRAALQASGGFSTLSLPGILSNTANKFLLMGFMNVEAVWRTIAAIRPVSDFKTVTSYRLTGSMQYEKVAADGKIKSASTGEESFTNKAETYGVMYSVTRQDIINDDLGALTTIPRKIGRGAGLKINDVFWTAFMDNGSFFTGAHLSASSALGINGLTSAEQKFLEKVDPDGKPLSITPRFLLTPPALSAPAAQLMKSTELRDTTSNTKYGTANPHAGKFEPLVSAYLSNTSYTGNSSTSWYLLGDPADVPVIEVAVLNGREQPVVESADADFDTLGIQMRGYHDFGVAKQDARGGVKATA